MKNVNINFSGSFISYINTVFPEIQLNEIIQKINKKIKKNISLKKDNPDKYKIFFENDYYDYEHAFKVLIKKEEKETINEVMMQDFYANQEKSIGLLSKIN